MQVALLAGVSVESRRMQMDESIRLSIESLQAYRERYDDWAVAWSGGKDSTALLTFTLWAIESGQVRAPRRIEVLYADTRMELVPLYASALDTMEQIRTMAEEWQETTGCALQVRSVMAPIEKRLLPYMLGRGVPCPTNTMRWCTGKIKVEPMHEELLRLTQGGTRWLLLTGVRLGESVVRDDKIAVSCSRDGAECGQGWFQERIKDEVADRLSPLVHWRVCHVWEWLRTWAPRAEYGDWDTQLLAEAYGGEEAEESKARTGCVGCPVASEDKALEAIVVRPGWGYLRPLTFLRPLFWRLREPAYRLRQPPGERRADGKLVINQNRLGPLQMGARRSALAEILAIQAECNRVADQLGRPRVDILNSDEVAYIHRCWEENLWPRGWTGTEPAGHLSFHVSPEIIHEYAEQFGALAASKQFGAEAALLRLAAR